MRDSKLLIGLPWLALPLVTGVYWGLWKRIPDNLAVHFDTSGAPNGYMSKWTMLDVRCKWKNAERPWERGHPVRKTAQQANATLQAQELRAANQP